jgi:hypothetical protein
MTVRTVYYLNGKEVEEAEWYANGGLEAEEALDEANKMIDEINKKYPPKWTTRL